MKYTCKCCGFITLNSESNFDICEICDWEDDEVQNNNPLLKIGANNNSLYECQLNIISKIPLNIKIYNGFKRDKNWKIFSKDKIINSKKIKNGIDYFNEL